MARRRPRGAIVRRLSAQQLSRLLDEARQLAALVEEHRKIQKALASGRTIPEPLPRGGKRRYAASGLARYNERRRDLKGVFR